MNKPKKTYSDAYKAQRRINQKAWLDKKRQDPLWVKKQKQHTAEYRGFKMSTSIPTSEPIVEPQECNTQYIAPGTMTEDEVKELVSKDIGRINRLRLLYLQFSKNSREQAGETRRRNSKEKEESVPARCEQIGDKAIKALKDHNIMVFVNEFKYQLYVKARNNKDGNIEQLGPYCSPLQATINGGIRPFTALKRALEEATKMFKTKQSG